jgi:hypothetical protein
MRTGWQVQLVGMPGLDVDRTGAIGTQPGVLLSPEEPKTITENTEEETAGEAQGSCASPEAIGIAVRQQDPDTI